MLRLLVPTLLLLALATTVPSPAAACTGSEDCFPEVVVCQHEIPWMCAVVDPDDVADVDWDRLIGPCTCDPID